MPWATNEFQRAFTSILSYVKVMNITNKLGHHVPPTESQSCAVLMAISLCLACGVVAGQSVTLHLFEAILYGSKKKKPTLLKVKMQC